MTFSLTRRAALAGAAGLLASSRVFSASAEDKGIPFVPNSFGVLAKPRALPVLSFQNEQGQEVPLSHWFGKPFVLHFWATWCPPCIRELPSVNATAKALGADGPQIVTAAVRGSTVPKVRAFYNAHKIDALPLLVDPTSSVMMETADQDALVASIKHVRPDDLKDLTPSVMALHGVPRSLLLNAKGEVVAEAIGNMDWSADAVRHTLSVLAG